MAKPPTVNAAGLLLVAPLVPDHTAEKFLLMRHRDRWDLPKGHCEPDESLIQTALRETAEETGIDARIIRVIEPFSYSLQYPVTYRSSPGQQFNKNVTYFLGRLSSPCEIRCTEHQGYQWFDWAPPHRIQLQTIDPLLAAVETFFRSFTGAP